MNETDLSCKKPSRRQAIRDGAPGWNGLDYLEVVEHSDLIPVLPQPPTLNPKNKKILPLPHLDRTLRDLHVFFLNDVPDDIGVENILIEVKQSVGGVTPVKASEVRKVVFKDPEVEDYLHVILDQEGNPSATYCLQLVEPNIKAQIPVPPSLPSRVMHGIDPLYSRLEFRFTAGGSTDVDCKKQVILPPEKVEEPEINYLAKDYASFRQLILDRLALIMPDWKERHISDLGMTLVELLAYAGDQLSYYQDAVATEAYLDTARQRISVRRHTRLVDYHLHEGCNARAWVHLHLEGAEKLPLKPGDFWFITSPPSQQSLGQPLAAEDLVKAESRDYETFEPLTEKEQITFYQAHNQINIYTWQNQLCCLPKGTTSAILEDGDIDGEVVLRGEQLSAEAQLAAIPKPPLDPGMLIEKRTLRLGVGDFILFEERVSPETGQEKDADPTHRHVIRLTSVKKTYDRLPHPKKYLLQVEWDEEDVLPFDLRLSAIGAAPECEMIQNISVARGNILLVDHGKQVREEYLGIVPVEIAAQTCVDENWPSDIYFSPGRYQPVLGQKPLTCRQLLKTNTSAVQLLKQDPRQAVPQIKLVQASEPGKFLMDVEIGRKDIVHPKEFAIRLKKGKDTPSQYIWSRLDQSSRHMLEEYDGESEPSEELVQILYEVLNAILENIDLYDQVRFMKVGLGKETHALLELKPAKPELIKLRNRWLLEDAFPYELAQGMRFFLAWELQNDLLSSQADQTHFVVEVDNDGFANLRFGDDDIGRAPEADMAFHANCRVGNGPSGNVGAGAINQIVLRDRMDGIIFKPSNPLPAQGGTPPEPVELAKLLAPYAYRQELRRAVIAGDYAQIVERDFPSKVQRAVAEIKPVKSEDGKTVVYENVWIYVDQKGKSELDDALAKAIKEHLERYRRIGHQVIIESPVLVTLGISLKITLANGYDKGRIEPILCDLFSDRQLPDGRLGFFHPDNLVMGEGIYLSKLVTLALSVPEVQNATVVEISRKDEDNETYKADTNAVEKGVLTLASNQVPDLGNMELTFFDESGIEIF